MKQFFVEFLKVQWLRFQVRWTNYYFFGVDFSGFCVPKAIKIGSFLTELFKE